MTDVVFTGFDVAALMTAAGAQATGSQKAKYSSDVATQLGANPLFEIQVGNFIKYRAVISGSLSGSSAGITIPTQFSEPPTVNEIDALTAANAAVVIRHATNTSIQLRIPVKHLGAAGFLTASAALNGTATVRTSALVLKAPATLDVGGGGVQTPSSVQNAIDDMIQPTIVNRSDGSQQGVYHGVYITSHTAMAAAVAGQYNFADAWDCVVCWIWVWEGFGNGASNTRVALKNLNCWLLLDSYTGSWHHHIVNNRLEGYVNTFNSADGNDYGNQLVENDGITTSVWPDLHGAIELWPYQSFYGPINATLMKRVRGIYVSVEASLMLRNPNGTDDRSSAKYWIGPGYDLYSQANQTSGNPNLIGHTVFTGNYPKHAMPGGSGRYKLATIAPQIHSLSPLQSANNVGSPPPWGNYSQSWPYQYTPWVMSQQQFRDNPPDPLTT